MDRPASAKCEAVSHSCSNAAALQQRYRRENVYFHSLPLQRLRKGRDTVCMCASPPVISQRGLIRRGIDEWKITRSAYARVQFRP